MVNGETITDQRGINDQFKSFYEDLYSSEVSDDSLATNFLKDRKLPTRGVTVYVPVPKCTEVYRTNITLNVKN